MKPFAFLAFIAACSAPLTPQEKTHVADTTYSLEMVKCVDDATTLEQSKACRARVRAAWHVDGGAQ